jgi:hypothetical protein
VKESIEQDKIITVKWSSDEQLNDSYEIGVFSVLADGKSVLTKKVSIGHGKPLPEDDEWGMGAKRAGKYTLLVYF